MSSEIEDKTRENVNNFFEDMESTSDDIFKNIEVAKVSEENINYIEKVSNIYKEILNREPDLGGLKHYSNQLKYKILTEEKLRDILKSSGEYKDLIAPSKGSPKLDWNNPNANSLVYCMIGTDRLNEIKPYIETVLPFVDAFIFIDGGSIDGTIEYLTSINKHNKIKIHTYKWKDKFSEQRNNYLDLIKSIDYNGWVITSDTDEHFTLDTLNQLRNLISNSGENYSGIKFQVEDVTVDDDDRNKIIDRKINNYWKPLMFKFNPEMRYIGEPHETLVGHNIKWLDSNLIYQHTRSRLHILTRATENFFISNSNRWSDKWAEFRYLCTTNDITTFKDFWNLFKEHKLPSEVEVWISQHKDDNEDTGDSEVREMALLYNEILPKRKEQSSDSSTTITVPKEGYSVSATLEPCCHIQESEKEKDMTHEKRETRRPYKFFITEQMCDGCTGDNKIKEVAINQSYSLYMCEDCLHDLYKCLKEYFGEK